MTDFLREPALPAPLDLSMVDPALLAAAPERLLALAADLLLQGDWARGGEFLDLLDRIRPPIPPDSPLGVRLTVMRATRYSLIGDADQALCQALAARRHAAGAKLDDDDEWLAALLAILLRAYTYLENFGAVDREAAAALAIPPSPSRSGWCWSAGRRRSRGSRPAASPTPPMLPEPPGGREAAGFRTAPLGRKLPAGPGRRRARAAGPGRCGVPDRACAVDLRARPGRL
jgi:hypothetical protein